MPGQKCLNDLIRGSQGGVKVLYKYTRARRSRDGRHLSGGPEKCHLYQTMPSPSTHISPHVTDDTAYLKLVHGDSFYNLDTIILHLVVHLKHGDQRIVWEI